MIKLIIFSAIAYFAYRFFSFLYRLFKNPSFKEMMKQMSKKDKKKPWQDEDVEEADYEDLK